MAEQTFAFDTELPSPSFVVDVDVVKRNCTRMIAKAKQQGVRMRPHVKTHKAIEGARLQCDASTSDAIRIVASTLQEAEFFAKNAVPDILYGVPLEPSKFVRAWELHCTLPSFHVMIESREALDLLEAFIARQLAAVADQTSDAFLQAARRVSVFLAADATGYKREGVDPSSPASAELAVSIGRSRRVRLAGIYSHSGNSYNCSSCPGGSSAGAAAVAAVERDVMMAFARRIRDAGVEVPVISLGATPSASSDIDWSVGNGDSSSSSSSSGTDGLNIEVHPGNYLFLDRQQGTCATRDDDDGGRNTISQHRPSTIVSRFPCSSPHSAVHECGSGSLDDVAIYVIARVIGVHPDRGEILVDAGGCALHKDPAGMRDGCYGQLKDDTRLYVKRVTQEVSVIGLLDSDEQQQQQGGSSIDWSRYSIGRVVRIIPNHSCMTAACHDVYHVVTGDEEAVGGSAELGTMSSSGKARRIVDTWKPCKFW